MVGAGLSGFLGNSDLEQCFFLRRWFGVFSIISVMLIPKDAIDDRVARSMADDGSEQDRLSGWQVLVECKPLLILAAAMALFHLGNGAMLPL